MAARVVHARPPILAGREAKLLPGPFFVAGDNDPGALTTRRRLPIGMQTFREIREQNCCGVDKLIGVECSDHGIA